MVSGRELHVCTEGMVQKMTAGGCAWNENVIPDWNLILTWSFGNRYFVGVLRLGSCDCDFGRRGRKGEEGLCIDNHTVY